MLFRQNNFCMDAALGSQYGAMTVATEILIAQLHSQSELTTAWHKNKKIWYENKLLKAKEPALSNDTKKHTTKYHETIPLRKTMRLGHCNTACNFREV
jgi:hypothetical protein